jgi:parallel beta-helix repeat protein
MGRFILILLLICLVFPVTPGSWAVEYYVSTSGSDSNPGTMNQPWRTVRKAANTLRAGDTLYIRAGTYRERVVPKYSGKPGKYITYTAYPGDTVIIDGLEVEMPPFWGGLLDITGKEYITISGLQIRNAGPDDNNQGILVDGSNYIIIENNHTYNTTSSGIGVWNSSNIIIDNNEVELACSDGEQECITVAVTDTFEIRNNHVHHSGPGTVGGEGIDAKDGSSNGKVYNNHVHDINRLGIYVDAWDKHTYHIEIYGNLVHDINGNDGFTLASEMGGLLENIRIYNNIAYNCGTIGLGIGVNGDSPTHPMKNITAVNNTFFNNGIDGWGGGIAMDNPFIEGVVIRNNIVSKNVTFQIVVDSHVPMDKLSVDHNLIHGYRDYIDETRGTDYVEGNPLFVNASAADFHLRENSPAVDAGSSISAPSDDYDGISRPWGYGYDIGAYEFRSQVDEEPEISLSRTNINFSALAGSTGTVDNTLIVENSGTGTLEWFITVDTAGAAWLSVSPASGTNSGIVTVTVDPSGLSEGNYTGALTVGSLDAVNSPQTVTVNLAVKSASRDEMPFGSFDTPADGSSVSGSVPMTGWALDDIAVKSIKIYRDASAGEGSNMVYIGDALPVEGARPDIESSYPGYPDNSRAGWGYMLLTNFLPGSGNGTVTLYAVVTDSSDQLVVLGTKTVVCDNAHAAKPFGTIDTPAPGGTASGSRYRNHGWVLTPMPNSIPTDGSTIDVYVDGIYQGHPVYNVYRPDVAALFPGYANSNGAHAYIDIDTTAFANGMHTIEWTVTDNAGNSEGIGSRYIFILN